MEAITRKVLLKKGAEANIYLGEYFGFTAVFKVRVPKKYRDPRFDSYIRRKRTINEAKSLMIAHELGVPTPALLDVDIEHTTLVIEYIKGHVLRDLLIQNPKNIIYFKSIGEYVGKLHAHNMYHGDLTTANMIVAEDGRVYLIDFGLSGHSTDIEDYAIDVHLMLRTLESTHYEVLDEAYKLFIEGYSTIIGKDMTERVLERVKEIRLRGRYVEERLRS